jgi:hypothetical protein
VNYFPPPTHDTVCAKVARIAAPGFGFCGRCGLPWRFVEGHSTTYQQGRACFPLCESCWELLATAEARMPYYRSLVFETWCDPDRWPDVESGVVSEVA